MQFRTFIEHRRQTNPNQELHFMVNGVSGVNIPGEERQVVSKHGVNEHSRVVKGVLGVFSPWKAPWLLSHHGHCVSIGLGEVGDEINGNVGPEVL